MDKRIEELTWQTLLPSANLKGRAQKHNTELFSRNDMCHYWFHGAKFNFRPQTFHEHKFKNIENFPNFGS